MRRLWTWNPPELAPLCFCSSVHDRCQMNNSNVFLTIDKGKSDHVAFVYPLIQMQECVCMCVCTLCLYICVCTFSDYLLFPMPSPPNFFKRFRVRKCHSCLSPTTWSRLFTNHTQAHTQPILLGLSRPFLRTEYKHLNCTFFFPLWLCFLQRRKHRSNLKYSLKLVPKSTKKHGFGYMNALINANTHWKKLISTPYCSLYQESIFICRLG